MHYALCKSLCRNPYIVANHTQNHSAGENYFNCLYFHFFLINSSIIYQKDQVNYSRYICCIHILMLNIWCWTGFRVWFPQCNAYTGDVRVCALISSRRVSDRRVNTLTRSVLATTRTIPMRCNACCKRSTFWTIYIY